MPGPQASVIELSKKAQRALENLASSHRTEQQIAKRARIILEAAAGQDAGTISRIVGVTRKTVYNWRQRWLCLAPLPMEELSVRERLEDLPRAGAPPTFTADQRCQLEAMACLDGGGDGEALAPELESILQGWTQPAFRTQ